MADSTQASYEKNKEISESDSIESSSEVPFERLEKVMREGFQAMTSSMDHLSQSVVQTVERGHMNTTLQGNETRPYLGHLFERAMQAEQEDRMVRKEDERPLNAETPLLIQGYFAGQTSDQPTGFNVTTATQHVLKVISPPKDVASQHFAPFGTPSKYQAPKISEPALPPEPVRRNMHADRWREPAGFNVHIAHNNGNNGGNGQGRQNNARVPEQIQESNEKEDVGQAPPVGAEPAPRNHPDMDICNEMEALRQLVYNGQAGIQRPTGLTYQKPDPAYIDDLPFRRGFKVPSFSLFNGEDLYALVLEHIGRFSAQCISIETQPLLKLRLFGSSLSSQAFIWYSNLSPNSILGWAEMEGAFME
ncbi:unnamed protein product [Prunus armeniaca]|uniref:Retrotransposon gag domain-containing protein n=1 Tax=Prunus armeniaca TaxID=36596 RepID=A0A6J5TWP4_PRUAR|nr:unnamed protein product [Prunus armeniaca]CAB4298967.1 unnamed protein product [Prunus armeniaca]